jgi:GH15 family glucan-1,4-alpha-glucosidase
LGHESLFVDLRAFHALRSCGKRKHADEMLAWVIERVSQNGEMVPEYFSRDLADYIGPYPLIGLGAAPLILAILAR